MAPLFASLHTAGVFGVNRRKAAKPSELLKAKRSQPCKETFAVLDLSAGGFICLVHKDVHGMGTTILLPGGISLVCYSRSWLSSCWKKQVLLPV
jgi:hypothetical protein